jgi:uncharacterized integral membrane protein
VCSATSATSEYVFNIAMLAFHCCLIFACLILSFVNRNTWSTFSESLSLSICIYITVIFAAIQFVFLGTSSNKEAPLYLCAYLLAVGSILLTLTLFAGRIRSAMTDVGKSLELSSSKSGTKSQPMSEAMYTEEIQLRGHVPTSVFTRAFVFYYLYQNSWSQQTARLTCSGYLSLPTLNSRRIKLSKTALVDRSRVVPFSFQLIGPNCSCWIRCSSEDSFLKWLGLLSNYCLAASEELENNI